MRDYAVVLAHDAQDDLERLFQLLLQRDVDSAMRATDAIERGLDFLQQFPHSCRRAQPVVPGKQRRELIVRFGSSGYLVLFEIQEPDQALVLAVRHQRESDYH